MLHELESVEVTLYHSRHYPVGCELPSYARVSHVQVLLGSKRLRQ